MADIYIAYANEDRVQAEWLYNLLAQQWETWWDDHIVGDFAEAIENEISKAKCLIAVFSKSSRAKPTFKDELRLAEKHKLSFFPVRIDNSDPPYPYGSYSYTQLHDWVGQIDHPGILRLKKNIATIVPAKSKPLRPSAIAGGKVLLPSLFMSVSSHETQLIPEEAVEVLRAFNTPTILVSAFDLVKRRNPRKMIETLEQYRKNGGFILVDSGNYEKSRLSSKYWNVHDLEEALAYTPHDWVFAFDTMNTKHDPDVAIKELLIGIERDKTFTSAPVLPIVHAPSKKSGGYKHETLPYVVRAISSELHPPLIAVPERELGAGLIARAKSVREIREELDKLPYYQPLHILGTGNPWSIALLAAAGADTFDGLEWCRFVIDRDNEKIHHFQHFDFFMNQSATHPLVKEALVDPDIGYAGKVAFHNLDYYSEFMNMMRSMFIDDNVEAFLMGLLTKRVFSEVKEKLPELIN